MFISSGLWAFGQRQESLGQFVVNEMRNCPWRNVCLLILLQDLDDEKLLTRILTKVHHTRKWLTCETCGANKRSVVGFISHLQCCQKSIEVGASSVHFSHNTHFPPGFSKHRISVHESVVSGEISVQYLQQQSDISQYGHSTLWLCTHFLSKVVNS